MSTTDRSTPSPGSASIPPTEQTATVVKIYVRLGARDNDAERLISFRIPNGIDPIELLDLGLALDGNMAAFTVAQMAGSDLAGGAGYCGPLGDRYQTSLTDALAYQQKELVRFLRDKGFTPQFA